MSISRRLSDVPEEGAFNPPNSPYSNPGSQATSSTNTLGAPQPSSSRTSANGSKRSPSLRTVGQSSSATSTPSTSPAIVGAPAPSAVADAKPADADTVTLTGPVKRKASSTSTKERDPNRTRRSVQPGQYRDKFRAVPVLPHDKEVEVAPSTGMYWSRAPVHGHIPPRPMRAHTVTLVDQIAWVLGGWDDREHTKSFKTVYCFDIGNCNLRRFYTILIPIPPRDSPMDA
jgi:hypothetical protein